MTIGHRTNAVYHEIVAQALDLEVDAWTFGGEQLCDRRLSRAFGGDEVVLRELSALRDWNDSADHYELGAFHNALLHAVLPAQLEAIHAARDAHQPMVLCGGRYVVQAIDLEAFIDAFFEDLDFALPADHVNALDPAEKALLGIDDAVFGVANALVPHPDELLPRRGDRIAFEEITELMADEEDRLRRRYLADPDAVLAEVAAMAPIYRRGEVFPYWPSWLAGGAGGPWDRS